METIDNPQTPKDYLKLGNELRKQGKLNRAAKQYLKALQLKPKFVPALNSLAAIYEKQKKYEQALKYRQQALQVQPENTNIQKKLAELEKQQERQEEKESLLNSSQKDKEGEIYSKIWNIFNHTNLEKVEKESKYFPQEVKKQRARQYFRKTSQYKFVHLKSLNEENISFLKAAGLSLRYLKQNQRLVTREGVLSKEKPNQGKENLTLTAAQDGYIYALCPNNGDILKSNRSFFIGKDGIGSSFCYRFVGKEVFYLIVLNAQKHYFYFPRLDLIVYLRALSQRKENNVRQLTNLKTNIVSNWLRVKRYIFTLEKPKKTATLGRYHSTAHHVMNDLSPIQKLYDNHCLNKIDKFIVHIQEFYGGINEIFPEIDSNRVQRITPKSLNDEILDDNLFAFGLMSNFVNESLAMRIYQASLKKCSSLIIKEIKDNQEKCFPLLWINFRIHKRAWTSQLEGTASISRWKDIVRSGERKF